MYGLVVYPPRQLRLERETRSKAKADRRAANAHRAQDTEWDDKAEGGWGEERIEMAEI
jgi:hypothetical protein